MMLPINNENHSSRISNMYTACYAATAKCMTLQHAHYPAGSKDSTAVGVKLPLQLPNCSGI